MRTSALLLTLPFALLAVAGCGESHTPGGCVGDEPVCLQGWSGTSACCLEGTETSASCVDDEWVCGAGTFAPSDCGRTDPVCEGVPPMDASVRACDAGPVDRCLRGSGGTSACCLEGDTVDPLCGPFGPTECPAGYFRRDECGRTDTVCEGPDAGSRPDLYDGCAVTSHCVVVDDSCCGLCVPPTIDDVAAVNRDLTAEYYRFEACPESQDGPVACPECEGPGNPHLVATCDMTGIRPACAVVDLATDSFAACESADDCVLATPTCCACGEIPFQETIAVRRDADLASVLCDDTTAACPPCVPTYDPRLITACVDARCVVQPTE